MPEQGSISTAQVDALLFDSDGVLVDSDASVLAAWSQWATEHRLEPDDVTGRVHGRRAADTVAELIEPAQRSSALARINELELAAADTVRALPGASELLTMLDGIPWAVVTSATRALATARLRAAGLPSPKVLITADDLREGKPSPEGYQSAADRLGQDTARCVVFEDSQAGVLAAHAAGVGIVVGVNLRHGTSGTWVTVPDLRTVTCHRVESGPVKLRVGVAV
ncbi:HAD-IA family hydrolase [Pedococcus sp. 5OH_020]|uniref:HAD-IA family hydrolase n=1 Tax=Pedococcus sp. 5OH_020 TaxID=2989814 RepID=UPI0022EA0EE8|nr:HAD-IA family hydrolase [Pedococcus sp. 5OH_020]